MSFEKYIIPSEVDQASYPKLSSHLFRAILQERIEGQKTAAQCIAALEEFLGVTLSTDDIADLQIIMNLINNETTLPAKISVAERIYRIFVIAEHSKVSWYNTRAKIKTRLGFK